jgi:threonine dehydrogenase-like Zn-dependent dehydrogenase
LVIGGNAVGQLLCATLKAMAPSAQIVLATDEVHEAKLAQRLGVNHIIPARAGQISRKGAALTNAQTFQRQGTTYVLGGFDIIYDCLGTTASLAEAVRLAQSGGLVVSVAAPARAVRVDPSLVQQDEITIVGVAGAGSEPPPPDAKENQRGRWSSMAVAARLLRKKQISIDGFITHRVPATRIRHALRQARSGVMRLVLTYE